MTNKAHTPIHKRDERLAILNGTLTTAKRIGRRWMVGGDFPEKTDSVIIAAQHKDHENGGSWWGWHKLKGCFLVFDDFMTDDEIAKQEALAHRKEQ